MVASGTKDQGIEVLCGSLASNCVVPTRAVETTTQMYQICLLAWRRASVAVRENPKGHLSTMQDLALKR